MKKIIILGGAGCSEIVASVVDRRNDMELVGFINDYVEVGEMIGEYRKIPVVGKTDQVPQMLVDDDNLFVVSGYNGVTNPQRSYGRLQELEKLIPQNRWTNVIDPSAVIPFDYCRLGTDIFIGPLAQTSTNVVLANHSCLMGGSFVGHNSVIGEFSHVTANAVVGANINVDQCVLIGPNSSIRDNVFIAKYSIIGFGSVVVHDVEPYTVVAGNPAKFLKKREDCHYGEGTPQHIRLD